MRRPIGISEDETSQTVVCDDGSVWRLVLGLHRARVWEELPPIPGTARALARDMLEEQQ